MAEKVLLRERINLPDDCLQEVCAYLDKLSDIKSASEVCHQFRQAAVFSLSKKSLTAELVVVQFENQYVILSFRLKDNTQNNDTPFFVLHSATELNVALVKAIHRIEIVKDRYFEYGDGEIEELVFLCRILRQFTAATELLLSENEAVLQLSSSCEPLFGQLKTLRIADSISYATHLTDNLLESICDAVCAMPKLVEVTTGEYVFGAFLKLTHLLQNRKNTPLHVFAAFGSFEISTDISSVPATLAALSLYPNTKQISISMCFAPGDNVPLSEVPVDVRFLQNLEKLKSFALKNYSTDLSKLNFILPAELFITDLELMFFHCTPITGFPLSAEFLKACRSVEDFKLCLRGDCNASLCTFPVFLSAFETHRCLVSFECEFSKAHLFLDKAQDQETFEHLHLHVLHLAARVPRSLKHLQLEYGPCLDCNLTASAEMEKWTAVIKAAQTSSLHITLKYDYGSNCLSEQLVAAMSAQNTAVENLVVIVNLLPDPQLAMDCENDVTIDPGYGVTNGTRQGSNDTFSIKLMPPPVDPTESSSRSSSDSGSEDSDIDMITDSS